jgi:hypothetical protein
MKFFKKLFNKAPVQTLEVVANHDATPKVMSADGFRSGVWVRCPDSHIGVTIQSKDGSTLVGMTDANGYNVTALDEFGQSYNITQAYPTESLRKATLGELPKHRMTISGHSTQSLRELGYGD